MQNATSSGALAPAPTPHELAQGQLAGAVDRLEGMVGDLDSKLHLAMRPSRPEPEQALKAISDESDIHIVNNLQSWTGRISRATNRLQDIYDRLGL